MTGAHAACAGTSFRPPRLCRMAAMIAGAWRPNLISHRSCQISQALWWACSLICPAVRVAVPLKQGAFCVLPPHLPMLRALWYNPRRLVRRMVATRWFETARLPAKFSTKAPEDLRPALAAADANSNYISILSQRRPASGRAAKALLSNPILSFVRPNEHENSVSGCRLSPSAPLVQGRAV